MAPNQLNRLEATPALGFKAFAVNTEQLSIFHREPRQYLVTARFYQFLTAVSRIREVMVHATSKRSALFLDRDGVINTDIGYVHRAEDFAFIDGIFELCASAAAVGMAIVVVTNQAGIGRCYYTETQFHKLSNWMCARFLKRGITIDGIYYCPFHAEHGIGEYKIESYDRKPNPGMILRARDELGLRLDLSVLIGDKASDIQAARSANVGRAVLFAAPTVKITPKPDLQAASLWEIRDLLFIRPLRRENSEATANTTTSRQG